MRQGVMRVWRGWLGVQYTMYSLQMCKEQAIVVADVHKRGDVCCPHGCRPAACCSDNTTAIIACSVTAMERHESLANKAKNTICKVTRNVYVRQACRAVVCQAQQHRPRRLNAVQNICDKHGVVWPQWAAALIMASMSLLQA